MKTIFFTLFLFITSQQIIASKCLGYKITVLKKEAPFGVPFIRDVFLKDDRLLYCEKKLDDSYTPISDTPFELINNIEFSSDSLETNLHLNKKDLGQDKLEFLFLKNGSKLEEVHTFWKALEQKLKIRRSWSTLEKKISFDTYSKGFAETLKMVKFFEESRQLELVPTSKGLTGAKIVKIPNSQGKLKAVGIFKGVSSDPLHKKLMGQASLLLDSRDGLSKSRAEVIAYYFAKHLGFRHSQEKIDQYGSTYVPEAIMLNLYGEPGVFINFLSGYTEPDPKREAFAGAKYNKIKLRNFQMLVIYDFLIANLDRHQDNLFIKEDSNNSFAQVRFIDQGNSFPFKNPQNIGISGRNMYKWSSLSAAQQPFLPEVIEHIRKHLNMKSHASAIEKIPADLWTKFFLGNPKEGAKAIKYLDLRRRFLLEVIAAEDNYLRPKDLVRFKMVEQMRRALASKALL